MVLLGILIRVLCIDLELVQWSVIVDMLASGITGDQCS
jgi:hypothetical protein